MPQLVSLGKELLRVTARGVEYSINNGRSWMTRYTGTSCGTFLSLADGGNQLFATTSKGLYYSINNGRSWMKR